MRRLIGTATAGLMAMSFLGGPATAAGKVQHVEGHILLRAPFVSTAEQLQNCYAGVHRRLTLAAQGQDVNGVVGWNFPVDPATYNKPFKLEVSGGQQNPDMDVTFYMNGFGTLQDHVDNPPYGQDRASVDFTTRKAGGEKGIVPKGATDVIVCMFDGYDADFMYMAGKGVK
jgi:hypothetical protein